MFFLLPVSITNCRYCWMSFLQFLYACSDIINPAIDKSQRRLSWVIITNFINRNAGGFAVYPDLLWLNRNPPWSRRVSIRWFSNEFCWFYNVIQIISIESSLVRWAAMLYWAKMKLAMNVDGAAMDFGVDSSLCMSLYWFHLGMAVAFIIQSDDVCHKWSYTCVSVGFMRCKSV